ncbi:MAG TPA: DUF997 domain-containing protein [Planctomycetota bacterium]|nr:DUF997 domain-containing protein [Planctomycetota bacterium]
MGRKRNAWTSRAFLGAFIVLTSLCWCPWAYGTLAGRVLGIPTWAVVAYGVAAALFVLEWVYLFCSGLAVSDEELPAIVSELKAAADDAAPAKEGARC